ncbi:MAG: toprim domain-containing protein [Minisyncoccota bacterium]
MDSLHKLIELFKEFPGIGPRQAKRFVYFLLTKNNGYTGEMSRLIADLKNQIHTCESCFRFCPKDGSPICSICRDNNRDTQSLMIVSRDVDFENIEKTKAFTGYYFILGGNLPVLEKNPELKIREKQLIECIKKRIPQGLSEMVIALDYNPEGEHTREHVERIIKANPLFSSIKITHLGRGLSTGSELEYTDGDTIKNALRSRV